MKSLETILRPQGSHWVGDGFPVRSLFSHMDGADTISPFLLLDYAGPQHFKPNLGKARGVGQHPHRGFETVTVVYEGEVSHRDSSGGGGTIKAGDVQWMTAGSGVMHEEFHSKAFSEAGGTLKMVQLWVNLPAKHKMTKPRYQAICSSHIPKLSSEYGSTRIIAGNFDNNLGPAQTFTPINLWDINLKPDSKATLPLPKGHNSLLVALAGELTVDQQLIKEAEVAKLTTAEQGCQITSKDGAQLLVLSGEPIDEPVAAHGPFVMNSRAEIRQAIHDFNNGQFGSLARE